MTSALDLVQRVSAYGPISLGDGFMNLSSEVPERLREELAERFWDARAILQEWGCVIAADSPIIQVAESIIAAQNQPQKLKRRRARDRAFSANRWPS